MMKQIQAYPLLCGHRGEPGVDLEGIEDLLVRVSRLVTDFPQISECDLNPILVYPPGCSAVAVDVRLKLRRPLPSGA
jgi:acetyltransferase